MILVILESPYAGLTPELTERNVRFARACLRDSLRRGEAPIASHLLYTQPGVLDDQILEERMMGIEAGLAWGRTAQKTVVYTNLGISKGMQMGIDRAAVEGREVEMRWLEGWPDRTVAEPGQVYITKKIGSRVDWGPDRGPYTVVRVDDQWVWFEGWRTERHLVESGEPAESGAYFVRVDERKEEGERS